MQIKYYKIALNTPYRIESIINYITTSFNAVIGLSNMTESIIDSHKHDKLVQITDIQIITLSYPNLNLYI